MRIIIFMLANVRSLDRKMDFINLWRASQRALRDFCAFIFTETWMKDKLLDSAFELTGLTVHRADRVTATLGKLRGGGLAVYINDSWCRDANTISKRCSPDVEFIVKCQPFYLPQ